MINNNLAPVVLFVYNRPWHTKQTLEALMNNELAQETILIIYSDGPKENASKEDVNKINDVREIIRENNWCGEVYIFESEKNKGLANSIIFGVTEVVNKYERIIVLEDDILPSKGFLKYMNDSLELYDKEEAVGCIHAWNYNLNFEEYKETTFFLKGADCWGWGTWKRSWKNFNSNGKELLRNLEDQNLKFEFDRNGSHHFSKMLLDQINGLNDSWAIRWHASLFLKNQYCLHPVWPIVCNIGLDDSGTHCGEDKINQHCVDFIKLNKIQVQESNWFYIAYQKYLITIRNNSNPKWHKLKKHLKALFRQ